MVPGTINPDENAEQMKVRGELFSIGKSPFFSSCGDGAL